MSRLWLTYRRRKDGRPIRGTIPTQHESVLVAQSQNVRDLFDRFRSRPDVARVLASSITLLSTLRDAIEPFIQKEGVRRGLLFGLGSFLILGVLILSLVQPGMLSPAQTIVASVLALLSVTAMLVMDLLD